MKSQIDRHRPKSDFFLVKQQPDPDSFVLYAMPFFMHYVHRFLASINRYDLILHYFEIGWLPMLEYGKTKTIWETWVPSSSECHAWSATPAYDLSTYWLGVKPLEPGFARVEISPTFFGLQWVDGIFPSCRGDIGVKWTKNIATTGTQIDLSIGIPQQLQMESLFSRRWMDN